MNAFREAAGGVHRGGRFCSKRLPYADFFGYFLVQRQESTPPEDATLRIRPAFRIFANFHCRTIQEAGPYIF